MFLIHLLQRFAALVSARDALAVVLLATTFGTAVWAFFREPAGLRRHRLARGAVALGAVVLVVAPRDVLAAPVLFVAFLAVVSGFVLHRFSDAVDGSDRTLMEPASRREAMLWIGAAVILAVFFLLTDLAGYANSLMVWEPEAMRGLVGEMKSGTPLPRFAASRLLWGQGLVSSGFDSFLFGRGLMHSSNSSASRSRPSV